MLETILFQMFMPFLINPGDPDASEAYRSGVGEVTKSYTTDKPPTDYPIITFDVTAYDNEFNFINPGIYAVGTALETKNLLVLERGKIVAKCPVIQVIRLDQKLDFPSAKVAFIKDNKIFIIYKNEDLEIHGFLYKAEE